MVRAPWFNSNVFFGQQFLTLFWSISILPSYHYVQNMRNVLKTCYPKDRRDRRVYVKLSMQSEKTLTSSLEVHCYNFQNPLEYSIVTNYTTKYESFNHIWKVENTEPLLEIKFKDTWPTLTWSWVLISQIILSLSWMGIKIAFSWFFSLVLSFLKIPINFFIPYHNFPLHPHHPTFFPSLSDSESFWIYLPT